MHPGDNDPARSESSSPTKDVKVFSFIDASKPAAVLSWHKLSFSVGAKRSTRKEILRGLNGCLNPGELTCILGPSGSGKTSLLNILAGRVRKSNKVDIGGEVRLNGKTIVPSDHQKQFGYVMQDDALLGTMTPREVLKFAARLRLDKAARASDSSALIEDLLQSLGLQKCANTMVGNELIKGISGGERKRTAVGAELITNPQITFLDEPTSGLDTGAAFKVITILQQLTGLQRSVLCTIHQPSSEIFHLFDKAIFLVQGQVVYHGPPNGIRMHFGRLGHTCPADYNPADFVMFLAQDESRMAGLMGGWSDSDAAPVPTQDASLPPVPKRKGFCAELLALSARECKNVFRDTGTLGARFGSTIFLGLIYSFIFFRIGSTDLDDSIFVDRKSYDLQSHAGAVTNMGISGMFGAAQPLLLTFALERPVFMREHASNMYGPIPYFLSKTVIELPLVLLQNLVSWLVGYWLMGLQGNFFIGTLASTLISLAAASTALFVGCIARDAKQGMEALFVPQILFAGFFIKMELVPSFMRWLQYICSLKWGMNILYLNEFEDVPGGERLLDANEVDKDDLWLYYTVLVGIFVGFRILATIALSRRAKAFYN